MNQERIGIVIPAYNATRTIKWCLDSIRNSDYPQELLEVFVVDNNSSDNLKGLMSEYPEFNYVLETKQGRSEARNKGLSLVTAPLVAFIDADVYLQDDWLKTLSAKLKRADIGGGGSSILPTDELGIKSLNEFRKKSIKVDTGGKFSLLQITCYESPMLNSAAVMYKAEVVRNVGGFDTSLERHEDIDLSKRVFLSGYNLFATWKTKAFVHYHGESWSDYFARAFRDGYTKIDYLRKWDKFVPNDYIVPEREEEGSGQDKSFELNKIGIIQSLMTILWLVKKMIEDPSKFWPIKFLIFSLQFAGRAWGKLTTKDNRTEFSIPRNLSHLDSEWLGHEIIQNYQYLFFDNYVNTFNLASNVVNSFGPVELLYLERFFNKNSEMSYENLGKMAEEHIVRNIQGVELSI